MHSWLIEHLSASTGLTENVAAAYVWLFWLHIAFPVAPFLIKLFRPFPNLRDYLLRGLGWWVVTGSTLTALALGHTASVVFFCLVGLLALRELFALLPHPLSPGTRALGYLLLVAQYAAAWYGDLLLFLALVPVASLALVPVWVMRTEDLPGYTARVGSLLFSNALAGFCLSHIAFLLALPKEQNPAGGGAGLLLFVVFLTQFSDLAQYVWGKLLGKRLVAPRISPKKTWAGLLGGLVTVAATAWILAPSLTPLPRRWAPLVGVGIGLLGFLGDLTLSAVKRDASVKDTGVILPGFGGVFDRVDSLVFAVPAFFYFLQVTGG